MMEENSSSEQLLTSINMVFLFILCWLPWGGHFEFISVVMNIDDVHHSSCIVNLCIDKFGFTDGLLITFFF